MAEAVTGTVTMEPEARWRPVASVVAFHAHPDDESLLTGGTLALLVEQGHEVLVVLATDGARGLAADGLSGRLGERRLAECGRACAELGLGPPVWLGYADSGEVGEPPADAFVAAPVAEAAARLAPMLSGVGVLLVYDAAGGYGHRDHRRVHEVGHAAAALAGTPLVLEATVDRTLLRRVAAVCRRVPGLPSGFGADRLGQGFTDRTEITHRIDVRAQWRRKRAALRAHASQARGGAETRTLAIFGRLPGPVFRAALGTEWFVQAGAAPTRPPQTVLPIPGGRS